MRVLLDTHVFLWWLRNDTALGSETRRTLEATGNEAYVSAVSIWEIGIKKALNKLKAPDGLDQVVAERGFIGLPVSLAHAEAAGNLERLHSDPFDRMLIAQARLEGLVLATSDAKIIRYRLKTLPARK